MPWYFPWSDTIKKRACRYLLQHYLGQFLKEKLTLDQLSLDLYNGTGTIKEVLLDVAAINEALDSTNVPVEIVDGFVGSITATIPWSALVSDNTNMEVKNMEITIQPKQRDQSTGVMFDSMFSSFSSMTTSMQLAQECLKADTTEHESAQPYEGLEMFAHTIEAVLSKVKMSFVDTIIRLEHLPKGAKTGAAIEVRINRIEYFDDQAMDQGTSVDHPVTQHSGSDSRPHYEVPAIAHKNFRLVGVTVYCDEFSATSRTYSRESNDDPQTDVRQTGPMGTSPEFAIQFDKTPIMLKSSNTTIKNDNEPIKIAAFMGRQEIKVKIKQKDDVAGPKLEIESNFGGVNIHLSPRQMHLLLEIAQGLATPDLCDNTNVKRKNTRSKPMDCEDFTKVEQELQHQLMAKRSSNRQTQHFFRPDFDERMTTHSFDDDEDDADEEDIFLSIGSVKGGSMEGSYPSSSAMSTNTSGSCMNPITNYRKGSKKDASTLRSHHKAGKSKSTKSKDSFSKLLDDPSADLTKYKMRISFLSLMLLHEDPPTTPSDALDQGQSSAEKLRDLSERYFGRVVGISTLGIDRDLTEIRNHYSKACPYDHIGVLCKPMNLEGSQKSNGLSYTVTVDLTVGLLEAVEALYDRTSPTHAFLSLQRDADDFVPEYCELLVFEPQDGESTQGQSTPHMYSSTHTSTPSIKINIQNMDRKYQSSRHHSNPANKTDVNIELSNCRTELDMTIIDRIHELLHPQPLARPNSNKTNMMSTLDPSVYQSAAQVMFSETIEEGPNQNDRKTDIKISTSMATVLFRFPIADLRSKQEHDQQWWKKNLQKELLIVELTQLEFHTCFWAQQNVQQYEFTCRDGHGLFQESADQAPVSFARISTADNPINEKEEGFDWPRFVIKVFPELHSVLSHAQLDLNPDDPAPDSLNGALSDLHQPQPSPFTCSRVMYDNEELVIPGDRQEMLEFEDKAVNNTKTVLELSIPNLNAVLPDQHFFELIYNRILNDLVLWEPLAPTPLETGVGDKSAYPPNLSGDPWTLTYGAQLLGNDPMGGMESFRMCKSGANYDSSSDTDENSGNYPSVNEQKQKHKRKPPDRPPLIRQSKMCFQLNIGRGRLTAYSPLMVDNVISATECGEFLVEIEDGTVFVDIHHNADPDLQYVCIHANRAALFHNGCVDKVDVQHPVIVERAGGGQAAPSHLHPTVRPTTDTCVTPAAPTHHAAGMEDGHDMVSVAIKIKLDEKQNNKYITVGLGVRGGTLQHRMTLAGQNWIQQVIGLFDVKEFPILGYVPPKVLTELHVHIWNCGVDYRPLYMPYCAMLTLESFSISSNVLANSPVSLLRFIFQDAALYISDKKHPIVDLKKNYVCVADVGMFELALRTSDGKDPKYPKLDLRISNNILHLRTCSDSFKALADLINYFASDGDLQEPEAESEFEEDKTSIKTVVEVPASAAPPPASPAPSPRQTHLDHEAVHDMMADAMRESSDGSRDSKESSPEIDSNGGGTAGNKRMFFIPKTSGGDKGGAISFRNLQGSDDSDEEDVSITYGKTHPKRPSPARHKKEPVKGRARAVNQPLTDSSDLMVDSAELHMSDSDSMSQSDSSIDIRLEKPTRPTNTSTNIKTAANRSTDEEFCIIDDAGLGIAPRDGEPVIRMLGDSAIELVDNHFTIPLGKSDVLRSPEHFPGAVYRYTLREMSVVWYMYGGKDFDSSPRSKTTNKSARALEQQRFGRVGKVGWQARGGIGRDIDVLMELQLSKVRLQHETFPEDAEQASRQIAVIGDVEFRDRLASSKINKFLYQYSSDSVPRQSHTSMFLIKALHVRPEPGMPTQECSLKVSIQPLRFNIDQDALHFLMMFFTEMSSNGDHNESGDLGNSTECDDPPVIQLGADAAAAAAAAGVAGADVGIMEGSMEEKIAPEELHIKFDEMRENEEAAVKEVEVEQQKTTEQSSDKPVFIKCFVFSPDVPIRLDYHGKRADMAQGTVANFVVGLAQLNCSELQLKRLHYRKGLLGMDKLGRYCRDEWLQDVMKNQLPSILGGVGPLHSLVQFVQGVKNLFWMPVEQYQKDGRIVRGLQKGTQSFMTCTAMSTLELTNRLVQTIQYVAEVSFDMVSPLPTIRRPKPPRYRLKQPSDMREGVVNAYTVITEGVKGTAETIVREAVEGHESKGLTGAVGGVLRHVPPTLIKPLILTTEATSNILGGMRNQLLPDRKKEDEDKWKPDDDS